MLPEFVAALIETIYLCAIGSASWLDFMKAYEACLPGSGSNFLVTTSDSMTGSIALNTGFTTQDIERFNQHYSLVNPWIPMVARAGTGIGLNTEAMLDRKLLMRTEYYNDFMRPLGLEGAVGVILATDQGKSFVFNTMTASADYGAKQRAADVLTTLAPHFSRAFDYMHVGVGSDSRMLLSAIGVGIVMTSPDLAVRFMNEAAQDMIDQGCGLSIGATGKCLFDDPEAHAAAAAVAVGTANGRQAVSVFARPSAQHLFRFTFVRMQTPAIVEYLEGPRLAVLIENRFSNTAGQSLAALADRYGLTRTEVEVARRIVEAGSISGAARMRGVSPETIRSQAKSIYAKLKITGKGELLRMLL